MCGIAGLVYIDGRAVRSEELERMGATLAHRGPDGRAVWREGPVGLAHARLAIIDVAGGDQPLSNEDGSIWIAFNGEIYNYRELREELQARHVFRTRSDTEVIVHGYEEWGERVVERLRGFFALALWDGRQRRLFLARDRLGKKPLFFARLSERLVFGSELRALLAVLPARPELDPAAVNEVLALRYLQGARTALRGIEQLHPGELVVFEPARKDGELRRERYWVPPPPREVPRTEARALAEYRSLFDAAVARRLESEVPLGLLLSGGIDSTAVLEALARVRGSTPAERIRTFTVAFTREKESEAPYARLAAEHFGTVHEEFLLTERDLVDEVARLLPRLDQPIGDPSILPTALIARAARSRVTVCLSGDGGDELFAGYERYARLAELLERARLRSARAVAEKVAARLPRHAFKAWKLARALDELSMTSEEHVVRELTCLAPRERGALLSERVLAEIELEAPERVLADKLPATGSLVERAMSLDLVEELPGMILTKVDRASMLASLEVRSPFLDQELVEWAQALPLSFKVRGKERKWIVKRALEGRVPPELLERPKMGFGTPLGRWFRHELADYLHDHLGSSLLARDGYLRQAELDRMLATHRRRARNLGEALWVLLALEVWYRTWVKPAG